MGQPRTDAELIVELIEAAEEAVRVLREINETARVAFDKHSNVGHSVTREQMDSLCRFLLDMTEDYTE